MDAVLEVRAFSVALGSEEVLARVSLTLRRGEILALAATIRKR